MAEEYELKQIKVRLKLADAEPLYSNEKELETLNNEKELKALDRLTKNRDVLQETLNAEKKNLYKAMGSDVGMNDGTDKVAREIRTINDLIVKINTLDERIGEISELRQKRDRFEDIITLEKESLSEAIEANKMEFKSSYTDNSKAHIEELENELADINNSLHSLIYGQSQLLVSDELQGVFNRLENKENVSIDEINNTPEIKAAHDKLTQAKTTSTSEQPDRSYSKDKIKNDMLKLGSATIDDNGKVQYNGDVARESRLDIIIGLPASGKSSAIVDKLSQEFKSRVIDNDEAKTKIPEFDNGWGAGVVHKESQIISDWVFRDAISNHDNIILPKVGSNADKLIKDYINHAKKNGYSVNVHYVELDRNKSMGRMISRYIETGRFLDPNLIEKYAPSNGINHIDQAYEQLKNSPLIDGYSKWDNDVARGEKPYLLETKGLDGDYINNARIKEDTNYERNQTVSSNVRIDGRNGIGISSNSGLSGQSRGIHSEINEQRTVRVRESVLQSKESGRTGRIDGQDAGRNNGTGRKDGEGRAVKDTERNIDEIIRNHQHYLKKDCYNWESMRADLTGADLSGENLIGADLTNANLTDANLTGATLTGADLTDADLRRANLTDAILKGADLYNANLDETNLTYADLTDADLTRASLINADLNDANLDGATLTGAILAGANLIDANLAGATLTGAILAGANLIYANLRGANLDETNLTYAKLACADLTRASLINADLTNANLTDATLTGAILAGANLIDANLRDANLNGATLTGADLTDADLTRASLINADLKDANLDGATLTKANLKGTDLEKDIKSNQKNANLQEKKASLVGRLHVKKEEAKQLSSDKQNTKEKIGQNHGNIGD